MTELKLGRLNELEHLNCGNIYSMSGKLTSLDLSSVPSLVELKCFCNEITELNLNQVPCLESLSCFGNQIKALDIRPLRHLKELSYWDESVGTKPLLIQRPDQHF